MKFTRDPANKLARQLSDGLASVLKNMAIEFGEAYGPELYDSAHCYSDEGLTAENYHIALSEMKAEMMDEISRLPLGAEINANPEILHPLFDLAETVMCGRYDRLVQGD